MANEIFWWRDNFEKIEPENSNSRNNWLQFLEESRITVLDLNLSFWKSFYGFLD